MSPDPSREAVILTATIELLGEHGYDALTLDAVAARARSSKATIYRRWRNKAEVVRAALDALDARDNAAIPDTGQLRSDLVAVMMAMREKATSAYLAMISDLVVASRHDALLAEQLRQHVDDTQLSPVATVLERAVDAGTVPPDVDVSLIDDVTEALIVRRLQSDQPYDRAFIDRVVDHVLLPLLRWSAPGS